MSTTRICRAASIGIFFLIAAALVRGESSEKSELERIPPAHRRHLSAGAQTYLHADRKAIQRDAVRRFSGRDDRSRRHEMPPGVLDDDRVSDPLADPAGQFNSGFTQSETSTAWCGNVVVVAFNDSGSLLPSFLSGGGLSFSGYSRSVDAGATFTDMGFLPVSDRARQLAGDPAAACADAGTFYYASLLEDQRVSTSAVSVSRSTDGGATFADPVKAVEKDADTHFLDKEWMAVDPANRHRLYVTYGDFDGSGATCGFDPDDGFPIFRTAIELVYSSDDGATWSAPRVVASACGNDGVAGSQVAVDDRGQVFVAWTYFPAAGFTNEIRLRKSIDGGQTFAAAVLVSPAVGVGDGLAQGVIRVPQFASLAIDRSAGPQNGNVYVSWHDGRYASTPDAFGFHGRYQFANIVFVRSTDGGRTFDPSPARVSRDLTAATDHFFPALGVDRNGTIGICYYDRSRDASNFFIDRRCARSSDGGRRWSIKRVNEVPFPSTTSQDHFVAISYQGDYDTLASDFLRSRPGLVGAYTDTALGTQDVKANRIGSVSDDDGSDDEHPPPTMPALTSDAAAGEPSSLTQDKIDIYEAHLARLREGLDRIPDAYRDRLSGAARGLFTRVFGPERNEEDEGEHDNASGAPSRLTAVAASQRSPSNAGRTQPAGRISDPSTDLDFSRVGAFTQNVTSTAWCGDVVVVGFEDTGSFAETLPSPVSGISFNGFARSTNAGRTFTDLGFLTAGTGVNFNYELELEGNPVVVCSDSRTFRYASIATDFGPFTSGVWISTSTDGGLTFNVPVRAVEKSLDDHLIDREWLAVDPGNPNNLFVTYTDFDNSGSICGFTAFGPILRIGTEMVTSSDGGLTWGTPIRISNNTESCLRAGFSLGSQVIVDGQGRVHVAWEQIHFTPTNEIRIARSTNGGASFGASIKVAEVNPAGEFGTLQGGININEFPMLAIDRSGGPSNGALYVAWTDGSLANTDPAFVEPVSYGFTDILVTRSNDGGARWMAPVRVNDNREPLTRPPQIAGRGTDQFMPALAVDPWGVVGVCYYDRRRDPLDFFIERRCARSVDSGRRWQNLDAISDRPFTSSTGQDLLTGLQSFGDYDTLASDASGRRGGFLGGYADTNGGHSDVRTNKF